MNERPGDVLDEAVKLFGELREWLGGSGGRERAGDDDVWSRVTAEEPRIATGAPRIATGAPECRDCPVCRAIVLARESGPDVRHHVREAGRSLLAAVLDVVAAYERTREPRRADQPGPAAGGDPIDIG